MHCIAIFPCKFEFVINNAKSWIWEHSLLDCIEKLIEQTFICLTVYGWMEIIIWKQLKIYNRSWNTKIQRIFHVYEVAFYLLNFFIFLCKNLMSTRPIKGFLFK